MAIFFIFLRRGNVFLHIFFMFWMFFLVVDIFCVFQRFLLVF